MVKLFMHISFLIADIEIRNIKDQRKAFGTNLRILKIDNNNEL